MRVLIVGAGLYGAVCAHELTRAGHQCRIIEKRPHIGGNVFTRFDEAAQCHEHVYGAHIFHTNNDRIWITIGTRKQLLESARFNKSVAIQKQKPLAARLLHREIISCAKTGIGWVFNDVNRWEIVPDSLSAAILRVIINNPHVCIQAADVVVKNSEAL